MDKQRFCKSSTHTQSTTPSPLSPLLTTTTTTATTSHASMVSEHPSQIQNTRPDNVMSPLIPSRRVGIGLPAFFAEIPSLKQNAFHLPERLPRPTPSMPLLAYCSMLTTVLASADVSPRFECQLHSIPSKIVEGFCTRGLHRDSPKEAGTGWGEPGMEGGGEISAQEVVVQRGAETAASGHAARIPRFHSQSGRLIVLTVKVALFSRRLRRTFVNLDGVVAAHERIKALVVDKSG